MALLDACPDALVTQDRDSLDVILRHKDHRLHQPRRLLQAVRLILHELREDLVHGLRGHQRGPLLSGVNWSCSVP